jgi:hypothetical protein
MAKRSLDVSHVYLQNIEARAGIFKHSMGARTKVGTLKSLMKTYFLQLNTGFFKLRYPKTGIDIISDFFIL